MLENIKKRKHKMYHSVRVAKANGRACYDLCVFVNWKYFFLKTYEIKFAKVDVMGEGSGGLKTNFSL